jgi:hypothetical protein
VTLSRLTFTCTVAALLLLCAIPFRAAEHNSARKDDATKTPASDPLAGARTAAGGDAVLEALLTELDRSKA